MKTILRKEFPWEVEEVRRLEEVLGKLGVIVLGVPDNPNVLKLRGAVDIGLVVKTLGHNKFTYEQEALLQPK